MSTGPDDVAKWISILKEEHQQILSLISKIESSDPVDESSLKNLFHFVEDIHHAKEENFLFPHLAHKNCLRQGGPLCSYFMSLRLDLDPLSRMRNHLQEYQKKAGISFKKRILPNWLTPQNPLSIPMEEHETGHALSTALKDLMGQKNDNLKREFFKPLLYDYFALLKAHIQKEDLCLFAQCLASLS